MSNNEWMNRTAPDDHQLPGMETEYPIAQWLNGIDQADGPLGQGGFELPLAHFKNLIAGQPIDIPHNYGASKESGYLLPVMHLAIVQIHTAYFLKDNIGQVVAWSATPRFGEGYRSKVLYFCYAAEIEEQQKLTPFVLSVKSTIAREFKALLRSFRSQILTAADQFTSSQNPHYLFYVPIGSNGKEFYPDAAIPYSVSPPIAYWDTQIGELDTEKQMDAVGELAIPDYLYQHIISTGMNEAKAWKEAMANRGNAPNDPSPPRTPEQPTPAPISPAPMPPPPPSPPMTEAQAVASAQAVAPPTLTNKQARQKFQDSVGAAIVNGQIDHITASELANDANNHQGWLGALATLEGSMAA